MGLSAKMNDCVLQEELSRLRKSLDIDDSWDITYVSATVKSDLMYEDGMEGSLPDVTVPDGMLLVGFTSNGDHFNARYAFASIQGKKSSLTTTDAARVRTAIDCLDGYISHDGKYGCQSDVNLALIDAQAGLLEVLGEPARYPCADSENALDEDEMGMGA